jgi:hypothetical protein
VEAPLTEPWRNDPNIWCKAGVWSIRNALAFAQVADLVIGPETGVLNAVSMENNAKILFLSHSTVKNLCRDWNNTIAFAAVEVPCYPCHRLHTTGFEYCTRHADGCAACAVAITAEHVWGAVRDVLGRFVAGKIPDFQLEEEAPNAVPGRDGDVCAAPGGSDGGHESGRDAAVGGG